MNAKLLFKIRQNKPKITYLLIAANFFLLFSLYYCIFCCCLSIDPSVGRHLCFERDKKRYRGTKNDITGQKTISGDISFLCHRVIALIKAQVCDKYIYTGCIKKKVIELWSALARLLYNLQKYFLHSRKDQAFSFRMSPFLCNLKKD